jgi:hypothetical protein
MASPFVATIEIPPALGSLSVELSSPLTPQALAGVLWRYSASKAPEGKAGAFTPTLNNVPIGALSSVRDKYFLVEGTVLHHNDPQPVPYQVVVSISRNGTALHSEVPPEGGTGQIKDKNMPFIYRFQIKEVP